ncbi:MAG TPA: CDP-alcohol phosphatidyltransferase family protein [Cycloclasticus sp.]|jgi:cardiolipin synthase|nr:CDP-alcohol phosphatidyltransferase family protein [Cycloclasticus sp.]
MTRKDIPNAISMMRILLVAPIVYLLLNQSYTLALIFFVVAGISDALDGFLAKRYDWTSQLGSFLDPLADKLLLVSCFWVCVLVDLIPVWLFAIILIRDLLVAFGALAYHFMVEEFNGEPPFSSKLNTTFQIIYLVMLISSQQLLDISATWIEFALYSVAATTAISGLEYLWVWGMKAWNIKVKGQYEQR